MSAAQLARIAQSLGRADAARPSPRHRLIAEALMGAIERGRLKPGCRLPPETKLAALFRVSLGTVQKALARLAALGFLSRARRRGTFVAGRRAEDVVVFRFRDPATGQVLVPFTRVLAVAEERGPGPWRAHLGAGRCVRVDRLVWVENDPPAFSRFYIAHEHGRHLLAEPIERLHGVSFHRILGKRFNLPTLAASHRLQCRRLSPAACRHLGLPRASWGTAWDIAGHSSRGPTTYQSLEMPAGHRPVEFEMAGTALGRPPAER
jgi:DNA-binding GntR family transcriptional regulator